MGNFLVIVGFVLVAWIVLRRTSEIKRIQEAQNAYIYKVLREINPDTQPPPTIKQITERSEKPFVWSPSKDVDYIMSGKKVDMFD